MDRPWRIELLGGLHASRGDRVVTSFRSRKTAALLAYIAYYRVRVHAREELIELLWPLLPPEAGQRNLRVELSSLRRELEPEGVPRGSVLRSDRSFVQLSPTAVTTDVAQFQAMLQSARAGPEAKQARSLAAAVDLYCGELLPAQFEPWVLTERRRLEEQFVELLQRLTALSEQSGDLARALDWARRRVSADPLGEEGQYELIRLHAAAGHPEMALRQYQELERVLRQLGESPGLKSRMLARRIQGQLSRIEDRDSERVWEAEAAPRLALSSPLAPTLLPTGTVTFMYTDVEASTPIWEHVGPPFLEALAAHDTLLRQSFREHEGFEVNELGEGFLVAFQEASSALACAVSAQKALAAHAWPEAVGPLRVRMMLHTADDVKPVQGNYRLLELHHGDRMVEAAHGGQILCSEKTARLLLPGLGEAIQLVDLGLHRLRGVAQLARLFQVDYPEMAQRLFPPLRAPRPIEGSLPLPLTRMVGREPEIEQLCETIGARFSTAGGRFISSDGEQSRAHLMDGTDGPRLITLTGPGGTGKTRLAQEVAHRLSNLLNGAVWFVSLADLSNPQLIPDRILETMRLSPSRTVGPLDQVVTALSQQPSLLLLDNYEHLAERGAPLVQTLLARVEGLTVLVTSRLRLQLTGEWEFRVPPLPTPPGPDSPEQLEQWASVSLFRERAQAADGSFRVTEANAGAVAVLCARLEGLPLALELAAARSRIFTPADMLAQLERQLDFLVSPEHGADPRQRSMRATYDWSYQLLPPEAQRFFARLSVFRGGFTLEAAQAVCSEIGSPARSEAPHGRTPSPDQIQNPKSIIQSAEAVEHLTLLLESSLIISGTPDARGRVLDWAGKGHSKKEEAHSAVAAEQRLPLLPPARAASRQELPEEKRFRLQEIVREYAAEKLSTEEYAATLERHAIYFLALSERAEPELVGEAQAEWLDRLQWERENLRAVMDWAMTNAEMPGDGALPSLHLDPGELGLRLAGALTHFWDQREYRREDFTRLRRLVALKKTQARTAARAKALQALGELATWLSNYREARALLEECVSIRRELDDRGPLAGALTGLGSIAFYQGDYEPGRTALMESLAISREIKDDAITGNALNYLGHIARTQGEIEAARSIHHEVLAIRSQLGDRIGVSDSLNNLGHLAQEQGDLEQARSLHERSLAIKEEMGDRLGAPAALAGLGQLCFLQGDLDAARDYYEKSRTGWQEMGNRTAAAWMLNNLGLVADRQGRYEEARWLLEQSLALRREVGDRWGIPVSLNSLGEVARHQGEWRRAVELFREGLAAFRSEGIKLGMVQCLENMGRAAAESLAAELNEDECVRERPTASTGAASCRIPTAARAVRLLGAAAAVRDALGTPLPPVDRADHERCTAALRAAMGGEAFAAAWADGWAMELEQAAESALETG